MSDIDLDHCPDDEKYWKQLYLKKKAEYLNLKKQTKISKESKQEKINHQININLDNMNYILNDNGNENKIYKKDYYEIICPTCRKENTVKKNQKKIIGSELECVVCLEKANIFLPDCGHINICLDCIIKLDKYNKK